MFHPPKMGNLMIPPGGGLKIFLYVHPENWGKMNPCWGVICFRWVGEKPPNQSQFVSKWLCSGHDPSNLRQVRSASPCRLVYFSMGTPHGKSLRSPKHPRKGVNSVDENWSPTLRTCIVVFEPSAFDNWDVIRDVFLSWKVTWFRKRWCTLPTFHVVSWVCETSFFPLGSFLIMSGYSRFVCKFWWQSEISSDWS